MWTPMGRRGDPFSFGARAAVDGVGEAERDRVSPLSPVTLMKIVTQWKRSGGIVASMSKAVVPARLADRE